MKGRESETGMREKARKLRIKQNDMGFAQDLILLNDFVGFSPSLSKIFCRNYGVQFIVENYENGCFFCYNLQL